ncbi:MAG TPA: hypothetical protein VFS97_02015 [Nitrososphaeraceae archaeon]|nr:hypothetical protein [Nitrososphaeraceae archaeon]
MMEPHDSIAFIGHNPGDDKSNIYIATGDSGRERRLKLVTS